MLKEHIFIDDYSSDEDRSTQAVLNAIEVALRDYGEGTSIRDYNKDTLHWILQPSRRE